MSVLRVFIPETVAIAVVIAVAVSVCWIYLINVPYPINQEHDGSANWLSMLYPSVFFAAGRGLGVADVHEIPELAAFFLREVDAFDVRSIPPELIVDPLDTPYELMHFYLLYSVGLWWRVFGVSIRSLQGLVVVFFGLHVLLLYVLLRLVSGRVVSVIFTVAAATSPAVFFYTNTVRDYLKAPFIIALLIIILVLPHRAARSFQTPLAILAGLVAGVGLGFRQDLLIYVPLVAVCLCWSAWNLPERRMAGALKSCSVYLITLIIVASPVIKGMHLEGWVVGPHTFVLGLSGDVLDNMALRPASHQVQLINNDARTQAIVSAYAQRNTIDGEMVNRNTTEYRRAQGQVRVPLFTEPTLFFQGETYSRAATRFMRAIYATFPHDIVVRAFSSVHSVSAAPLVIGAQALHTPAMSHAPFRRVMLVQYGVALFVARFGTLTIMLALALVAVRRPVSAFLLTVLYLVACGYPSLLFEFRHVFHLAFLPLLAMAYLAATTWDASRSTIKRFAVGVRELTRPESYDVTVADNLSATHQLEKSDTGKVTSHRFLLWQECIMPPARNLVLYLTLVLAPLGMVLLATRAVQHRALDSLTSAYRETHLEPVDTVTTVDNSHVFVTPSPFLPKFSEPSTLPPGEARWEYLAVEFDLDGEEIPLRIQYRNEQLWYLFSSTTPVPMEREPRFGRYIFFFPVYEMGVFYQKNMLEDLIWLAPHHKIIREIPQKNPDYWKPNQFAGLRFPEYYRDRFVGLYRVPEPPSRDLLPYLGLSMDLNDFVPIRRFSPNNHHPALAEAHRQYGRFFEQGRHFRLAAHAYRNAIRCNNHLYEAYEDFAVMLAAQNLPEAAEALYRQALQIAPWNTELRETLRRFNVLPL